MCWPPPGDHIAMTYDGRDLTIRQTTGYLLMRVGFVAYCGAWAAGLVWLVS